MAQKGDTSSGYRALTQQADDQDRGAGGCAREPSAVRPAAGQPLRHHGLSFDVLLADKALDSNWGVAEMNRRGATICISQRSQRKEPLQVDNRMFLLQPERGQAHCLEGPLSDTAFSATIQAASAIINEP